MKYLLLVLIVATFLVPACVNVNVDADGWAEFGKNVGKEYSSSDSSDPSEDVEEDEDEEEDD